MKVIRCARLDLPVDLPALQSEVRALPNRWRPHFQKAHYDGEWTVLPLRSIDGNPDLLLPHPHGDAPATFAPTPLLAQCPAIERFLAALSCPVMTARLLNLRRGAVIKSHRDAELAFEMGVARIHVPVFTNPEVEFVIEGQDIVMEAGSCWYINANLPHRVANRGEADRIHLVVDCGVDDWLRERFAGAEISSSITRRDPGELRQMIKLLRSMNTATALAMIPALEEELAGVA